MKIANVKKAELKTEFYEETKKYILLTVYIAMILAGLKIYKKIILTEYHISYFNCGFGLFESMMLAKIILLGNFLGIGERFRERPLIIKILYRIHSLVKRRSPSGLTWSMALRSTARKAFDGLSSCSPKAC